MQMRTLGGTGIKVTPYCLGAMMFGAWGNTDHADSVRIIHAALDGGVVGQLAEPERPGLFRQVPLGWVAMLVERLEVAEYPRDPLAATLLRLLVQRHIPSFWRDRSSIGQRKELTRRRRNRLFLEPAKLLSGIGAPRWPLARLFRRKSNAPQWGRVKAVLVLAAGSSPHVVKRPHSLICQLDPLNGSPRRQCQKPSDSTVFPYCRAASAASEKRSR